MKVKRKQLCKLLDTVLEAKLRAERGLQACSKAYPLAYVHLDLVDIWDELYEILYPPTE